MKKLHLKVLEQEIDTNNIWSEDKLERKQCAEVLTNLIRGQEKSLVLSINGYWGSGKTFFLKRWQKQLEVKEGFKAIYFNAWESDYFGDPLVAIIGQIWKVLKESDFKEIVNTIKETAKPLFEKTIFNTVKTLTSGIIKFDKDELKSSSEKVIEDYIEQEKNKKELRKRLTQLAKEIFQKERKPFVFIIDELDRCRPTFAIELLERIKHVFDIPNMIFILGIDRKQLSSSIKAVYGNIDVDGYLHRFFDMDFQLPFSDCSMFCEYLLDKYGAKTFMQEKGNNVNKIHAKDFDNFQDYFISFSNSFEFSLREIEHAIRIFICTVKNIKDNSHMYPELLVVLIVLRLKKHKLYIEYTSGKCQACKVIDFIMNALKSSPLEEKLSLNNLEASIYALGSDRSSNDIIRKQLTLLKEKKTTALEYLSERTKALSSDELEDLIKLYEKIAGKNISVLGYLSKKIELSSLLIKT